MQSLTDLNNFGNLTLDLPDDRPSGVVFNRMPPLQPYDIIGTINSTSNLVGPGIDITEIINYQQANVRYRVRIVTGSSPLLTGSTISWASLPTGITLAQSGTTYTLSGIKTIAHWEAVKEFLWTLPANYASFPNWYLDVAVLYYDSALGQERVVDWEVYDPRFYWIAQLEETSSSLTCSGMKVKNIESAQIFYGEVMCFNHIGPLIKLDSTFINAEMSMSCTGQSITILSSDPINITSTTSAFILANTSKDLLMEFYSDPSIPVRFDIGGITDSITILWGDGSTVTTSGFNGYFVGNHTYSSYGIKDILIIGNYSSFNLTQGDLRKVYNIPYVNSIRLQNQDNIEYITSKLPPTVINLSGCFRYSTLSSTVMENVSQWDTSYVTNMSYMFADNSSFNSDLSLWNTGNVIDMSGMFYNCTSFNQPIGNWSTGNVTSMSEMFYNCTSFNQPIGNWSTGNVTSMSEMFYNCTSFNQPIGNWNTTQVTDMSYMFSDASAFNQPIGNWNTTQVINMLAMFSDASAFNQPIGNWNTSNVTNLRATFSRARAFNQSLDNWNTANVTTLQATFSEATAFNGNIGNWNTSNVTTLQETFSGATAFNSNIGNWNTSNVTSFGRVFYNATSFNRSIASWDVNQAGYSSQLQEMFSGATSYNQDLSGLNIVKTWTKPYNFDYNTPAWTLPKPNWFVS